MTDVTLAPTLFLRSSDHRSWQLVRRSVQKRKGTGEQFERDDVIGYYADLGAVARRLLEEDVQALGDIDGAAQLAEAVYRLSPRHSGNQRCPRRLGGDVMTLPGQNPKLLILLTDDAPDCEDERGAALAAVVALEPDFQEVLEWFDDGLLTQEEVWRLFKIDVAATAWTG